MDPYTLVVCLGISWGGCGQLNRADFPSREACLEALRTMRIEQNGNAATNGNGRQAVAYCQPKP